MGWVRRHPLLSAFGVFLIIAFGEYLYRELVVRPEAERLFVEHFDLVNLIENELDKPKSFEFAYYLDDRLRKFDAKTYERIFSSVEHLYTRIRQPDKSAKYYELFRTCPEGKECIALERKNINLVEVPKEQVLSVLNTGKSDEQCTSVVILSYEAKLCKYEHSYYVNEQRRIDNSGFSLMLEFPRTALLDRCCGQGRMQYTKSGAIDWISGRIPQSWQTLKTENLIKEDKQ